MVSQGQRTAAPIRAFLAIQPPEDVRARLAAIVEPDQARKLRWRCVPRENIHLTLRFLGISPQGMIQSLMTEMDRLGRGTREFMVEVQNVSGFPTRRPTVIAAGLSPNPQLDQLADLVESVVTGIGFENDNRPFRPHITIARIPRMVMRLPDLQVAPGLKFEADELVLFRSELSQDGASYIRIHSTRLGG